MNENIVCRETVVGIAGNRNFLPYYTNSPWGKNEEFFLFFSEPQQGNHPAVYAYHPASGRTEKRFDLPFAMPDLALERDQDLLGSVLLPRAELLLIPCRHQVYAVDINSGRAELLFASAPGTVIGGALCASPDETLICGGIYGETLSQLSDREKANEVFVWSRPAADFVYRRDFDLHVTHFQFFPDGENILFAHEGPTERIPDRLNLLNWRTGARRCLYRHQHNAAGELVENIGHERIAGHRVAAVRYPVSAIDFGLIIVDPAAGSCRLVMQDDCWHCSANAAGDRLVADTMWWGRAKRRTEGEMDILYYDCRSGEKHLLRTVHTNPRLQIHHPHPQLNAAGDRVLFITRDGVEADSEAGFIVFQQLRG